MKILDIMTAPWAIMPSKLNEIRAIYESYLRGEKIDVKAIRSQLDILIGDADRPARGQYQITNGVAVIPIEGVIAKGLDIFSFLFGGVSTAEVRQMVAHALANTAVDSILLYIDSPGGSVDGTQELADFIYSARGSKPIAAWTDGMMASAAYYIGAAADTVLISGDMPHIGSIGVVTLHTDYSKANEQYGITETEIYAGKYKRIASSTQPLTEEGRGYLQDQVDYIYSIFIDDVARYRGVSVDRALAMADGKIFIGRQAIDVGLVDGVATYDQIINSTLPVMQRQAAESRWLAQLNEEVRNGVI